jgi:hypothetical protein
VIVLFLALEAGFRLGKFIQVRWPDKSETGVGAMVGAALALLGFLLAFVTSVAIGFFNERRQLVVAEANAIGTTYLRAGYLAGPYGAESRELLREYVDQRVAARDSAQLDAAILRSEQIHQELWSLAEAIAIEDQSPLIALYISALNEVIDLHTERINVVLGVRVPPIIIFGLYGVAILTMVLIGVYQSYGEKRNLVALFIMVLILSLVFLMVIDLDRSQQGLIQAPQDALIDLQRQLNTPP